MAYEGNHALLLARTAARLNRPALGRLIGRSSRWVQRVELGDGSAKITPEIKKQIAEAVGTSVESIFPDAGGSE
jgi:hypothetical protein